MTYYSTQLAALLAAVLAGLNADFWNGQFLFLALGGQMMAFTGESLGRLEQGLAGVEVQGVTQLENEEP